MKDIPDQFKVAKHFADTFYYLENKGIIRRGERSMIAQLMGITPPRLSEILNGRRDISGDELTKFVKKYGVNPFWILMKIPPILTKDDKHLSSFFLQSENLTESELSIAAESETNYKNSPEAFYLEVHTSVEGMKKIQRISIDELSKMMGLEEVKLLLEEIRSKLSGEKK